ncbi:hypothetical protein [Streptomyces sp. NBC_01363]|uniref:hypothetical protein n=1 Tax=Streptomyces sp. NBC_01363 TaxID=2903840 RepID=UPI002258A50A|nr:hypothetical protein [Streptomyces sp. NBC_01363]MCX4736004.1 hypothetical protein [Streptomyces sp. NBC_01363]
MRSATCQSALNRSAHHSHTLPEADRAATGAQRITLDFRLPDGTALVPEEVGVAVS